MRVETLQESLVAGLDDGRRYLIRADDSKPFNLPFCDHLAEGADRLVFDVDSGLERENACGLVDVRGKGPAIVEHGLGEPLVPVVLQ